MRRRRVRLGSSASVQTSFRMIQTEFGRNTIAKSYSKLYNMIRSISTVAPLAHVEPNTLFQFVLEGILFELRYEINTVEKMTEAQLAGARGGYTGKVGVFL